MRLVLFDIDGTLIDSGQAGTRALERAFREAFGIPDAFRGIRMSGKTDPEIMCEALALHGLESSQGNLQRLIQGYLRHLGREIENPWRHLKPGVAEALKWLQSLPGVALGLLTGNLQEGARLKLEPFGLNPYFPVGAFGSDHMDRNQLLPIALRRARRHYGYPFRAEDSLVVGDTPRDVACARPYGAKVLAVATGRYSEEELREAGAHLVGQSLAQEGLLLTALGL
jgi:phosphoglycolate phosphatase-like HAD superfamily hydrolase